jgi:exoribonuclease R
LFYSHTTSPIRRYSDLINQRQIKALLRKDKIPYNENEIRKLAIEINTNIEKILIHTKSHNKEVATKRSERLLKKLKNDNYENI